MQRLDRHELVDAVLLESGEEVPAGAVIGRPRVLVADRGEGQHCPLLTTDPTT
jgi:hypothetical protein